MGEAEGHSLAAADALILEAATGARQLSPGELQLVLAHVAQAGFDPRPDKRGRTAAEKHFQKHVLRREEWPPGTTLVDYLESARQLVLDPRSSVMVSRYAGHYQLAVIGASGAARGPGGAEWIVVEYRVGLGYWVTVLQPVDLDSEFLQRPGREQIRWLRRWR